MPMKNLKKMIINWAMTPCCRPRCGGLIATMALFFATPFAIALHSLNLFAVYRQSGDDGLLLPFTIYVAIQFIFMAVFHFVNRPMEKKASRLKLLPDSVAKPKVGTRSCDSHVTSHQHTV